MFDPYKIFEKDGVKIAVVGAVIEELPNIVLADYIKDYDVGNIVDNVRQAAQDARAKGAQIVIALIHAGDNYDSKTGPVFDVANQLGGAGENNGALQIDIPQGDITTGTLNVFLPFDNTIITADMTGAQIKTLLEQAVGDGGKGIQAAGLTFTYDPGAPSGDRIVSISKTDGTPVNMTDTSKTYKVATNNFVAAGGDGFAVYKTVKSFDTHILFRDALAQNIQQTGHITAQIQGRIKNVQNANPDEPVTRAEFAGLLAVPWVSPKMSLPPSFPTSSRDNGLRVRLELL